MSDARLLLDAYREMRRIRAFEDVVAGAHRDGTLPGLLHLSHGGEAVAVAVIGQLSDDDRVYTSHRGHGHFLVAGVDAATLMAELAGRETGLCGGRGGSMHLMARRAVMATGVVGGSLPVALGHAIALPRGAVSVVLFGDGAVQAGAFHETINLAALWRAPLLLVCENNGWAEFTARSEHTTVEQVGAYGELHGIPTAVVDGSDYEAVREAVAGLLARLRTGEGPALLECHVTRLRPHFEGDLRKAGEADGRDPLALLGARLRGLGVDPAALRAIDAEAEDAAAAALARALAEPPADPARDADLVFARGLV